MFKRAFSVLSSLYLLGALCWTGFLLFFLGGMARNPLFSKQLGPTVVGIGFVFALILLYFIAKFVRLVTASGGATKVKVVETEDGPSFDADAAIERYMAKRGTAERAPVFDDSALHADSVPAQPTPKGVDLPIRPAQRGFGRRGI